VTTGISAFDRATTIRLLCDEHAKRATSPSQAYISASSGGGWRPGARGPDRGNRRSLQARGRFPAGVICEVMRADGRMARRPDLDVFAANIHQDRDRRRHHRLPQAQRAARRTRRDDDPADRIRHGCRIRYEDVITHVTHVALVWGDVRGEEPVLVRVHSECLTGDVFGSQRCDCQAQLHKAMAMIADAGRGVLVYLRQEAAASASWTNSAPMRCRTRPRHRRGEREPRTADRQA